MNANGNRASVETTYVGEDENEADPAGLPREEEQSATVLLVGRGDVVSGQADQALEALMEQRLAPVEVIVVTGQDGQHQLAGQVRP